MLMLWEKIINLLELEELLDDYLSNDPEAEQGLNAHVRQVIEGVALGCAESRNDMIRSLYVLQDEMFRHPLEKRIWNQDHPLITTVRWKLEKTWTNMWLSQAELTLEDLPEDPKQFAMWYRHYVINHPLVHHVRRQPRCRNTEPLSHSQCRRCR